MSTKRWGVGGGGQRVEDLFTQGKISPEERLQVRAPPLA
jgi:hypothetical protein